MTNQRLHRVAGKRYDGSNILENKVIGAKILNKASGRNWLDLYSFYKSHFNINPFTNFEIASDACKILRRVAKGVPNSTLILSKFHATQPIFTKNNYATNRKWTKKVSKEEMGYYDYLNGDTDKITKFYLEHPEIKTGKTLLTLVKNNHKQMQNWKIATYGNNAEHMASEVKRLIGDRVMSE